MSDRWPFSIVANWDTADFTENRLFTADPWKGKLLGELMAAIADARAQKALRRWMKRMGRAYNAPGCTPIEEALGGITRWSLLLMRWVGEGTCDHIESAMRQSVGLPLTWSDDNVPYDWEQPELLLAEGHIPQADNQSQPIRDDEIPF